MSSEQITLTLGISALLSEMTNTLLTKTVVENGKEVSYERDLPMSIKYRLARNKTPLDRDAQILESQKAILLAKYGEPTEDGKNVVLKDPVKYDLFLKELEAIMETEVTHTMVRIDPQDMLDLTTADDIKFSTDALKMFIGYMTDDQELFKDLSIKPTLKHYDLTEDEQKALAEAMAKSDAKIKAADEAKELEEFKKANNSSVSKTGKETSSKTSTKTSTTKKTASTKSSTGTKKTTSTAKKSTVKKEENK